MVDDTGGRRLGMGAPEAVLALTALGGSGGTTSAGSAAGTRGGKCGGVRGPCASPPSQVSLLLGGSVGGGWTRSGEATEDITDGDRGTTQLGMANAVAVMPGDWRGESWFE